MLKKREPSVTRNNNRADLLRMIEEGGDSHRKKSEVSIVGNSTTENGTYSPKCFTGKLLDQPNETSDRFERTEMDEDGKAFKQKNTYENRRNKQDDAALSIRGKDEETYRLKEVDLEDQFENPDKYQVKTAEKLASAIKDNVNETKKVVDACQANTFDEAEVPLSNGSSEISGPLFSTPLDAKSLKKTRSEKVPLEMEKQRRSARNCQTAGSETYSSALVDDYVDNIPTVDLAKTYSKSNRMQRSKEKKATQKVSDWLRNASNISEKQEHAKTTVGDSVYTETIKGDSKMKKKLNKKEQKLKAEEEALGLKLKHLAEHVHIDGREFGFDFGNDDNDDEGQHVNNDKPSDDVENKTESLNSKIHAVSPVLVNDKIHKEGHQEIESAVIEIDLDTENMMQLQHKEKEMDVNNKTEDHKECVSVSRMENKTHKKNFEENEAKVGEGDSSETLKSTEETILVVPLRKRIFKTKAFEQTVRNCVKYNDKSNMCEVDPFEFKSSQNTPKKIVKLKGKGKGAAGKNNARNLNKQKPVALSDNIRLKQARTIVNGFDDKHEQIPVICIPWNKDSKPKKTILKGKVKDLDIIAAKLQQAEDYELLTSSQEAAERIGKEEAKDAKAGKRVRFKEPALVDFNQDGHIDIIRFRKAKEAFGKTIEIGTKLIKNNVKKDYELLARETSLKKTKRNNKKRNTDLEKRMKQKETVEDNDSGMGNFYLFFIYK